MIEEGTMAGWLYRGGHLRAVYKSADEERISFKMTALEILFDCQIKPYFTAFVQIVKLHTQSVMLICGSFAMFRINSTKHLDSTVFRLDPSRCSG